MSPISGRGKGDRHTISHSSGDSDREREERKDFRAARDPVGCAKEEIPERGMPLAMQPPEHGDPIFALGCGRERPNFVPPHDMAPSERAGGGEP